MEDIFQNNSNIQYEIAEKIRKRLQLREMWLKEAGLDSDPGSQAYEGYLKIRDKLQDFSGLGSSLPGPYDGRVLPRAASVHSGELTK